MGFGEDGEVKCALAPSYLFKEEVAEATAVAEGVQRAFAKQVLERPVPFGAGVMQFVLTIARGTFALPLAALRQARRLERDDGQAPNGGDGIGDSGAADGGTMLCDTSFSDRLGFASTTCNMFWHYHDRKVRPRARVGELTILVSTFLMSPCFRAVCRCAQGKRWSIGDVGHTKLLAQNKSNSSRRILRKI